MHFLELTKARYSVRNYSDRQVEKEKLDAILEAGNNAPTAANLQPQRILVIQGDEAREKLKKCTKSHFEAPCFLLICYNRAESWFGNNGERFGFSEGSASIDAAIVATHMIMEATELGLGTLWVAAFQTDLVKREFNLTDDLVPVILIPLGYPSDAAKPNWRHGVRKDISDTVKYL